MPRMQLRAPGDAELISCYRRHEGWGVWVAALPHVQPSPPVHTRGLFPRPHNPWSHKVAPV